MQASSDMCSGQEKGSDHLVNIPNFEPYPPAARDWPEPLLGDGEALPLSPLKSPQVVAQAEVGLPPPGILPLKQQPTSTMHLRNVDTPDNSCPAAGSRQPGTGEEVPYLMTSSG